MIPTRLTFALCFLAAPAAAQELSRDEVAQVGRVVETTLADTGVPSASVAVVRGGKLVFARAYGQRSDRAGVADANAILPVASVSKQFTAAALLLLEDEGKLSLDDTVSKHLPGITGGDGITLRQLVSHTSGLQDYWPQDYSFDAMKRPTSPQGILGRWARKPLDFQPGTQWQYSNTGYVAAGLIVEKLSSEPLMRFLERRFFRPLSLKVIDQDVAVGAAYPIGYERFALGPVRAAPPPARGWLYAAGGLAMSAADLARWNIARLDRAIMPAEDWEAQETPVLLADGTSSGYGLGVFVGTRDGRRFVAHDGAAVGFLTQNIVYPDDRAAVTVIINGDFSDAQATIAAGIAKIVLPAPDEAKVTARARQMFESLVAGAPDRARLTQNANGYFTPTALADYRTSLAALGTPTAFEPAREPRLRGGFVNRNYLVTYPTRKLRIVTYAEPGAAGRYEQFLVQPAS